MTSVILIRHGQTDDNMAKFFTGWGDVDLNATGYDQARRLSSRLASWQVSAVYSSPLRRTTTTASLVAAPHGLEPFLLDDLIEIRLGDWEGLQEDEVWERWPELRRQTLDDPSEVAFPNGESFPDVTRRAIRAFEAVTSANRGRQVLVVTHDIIIRLIVAYTLGVGNSIYRRMQIDNASLTVIGVSEGKRVLLTLNDTSHLGG